MRVAPHAVTPTTNAAEGKRTVPPRKTEVTVGAMRAALARGYERVTGAAPSARLLDVLTAQASLETGSGKSMYNYNFGGIKGYSPSGMTACCRTKEVLDGKEVDIRDGFRAYSSLEEGAVDYVSLMRGRFGSAMSFAKQGDVDGFAHALKKSGYYTAPEEKYAAALRVHANLAAKGAGDGQLFAHEVAHTAAAAVSSFGTADTVARVLDAISASTSRIAAPSEDSDRD